jgi:hypothetical protein
MVVVLVVAVQRHIRGVLLLDGRRRETGRSEEAVSGGLGRGDLGGPPTGGDSSTARALGGGGNGGVERRKLTHHQLIVVGALGVHGLRVLAEVVEPGELLAAVT